jgi:hypothetical protein
MCSSRSGGEHLNWEKTVNNVPMSVVNWLAGGERGISSETIVSHIWGLPKPRFGLSHPLDPDDLKRCLQLLEASPETKARFHEMKSLSYEWANLVLVWEALEVQFLSEADDLEWSSRKPATKTYDAMQLCFARAKTGKQGDFT